MALFAYELVRRGHTVGVATAWNDDASKSEIDNGVLVHRIRELPSRVRWMSENPDRHSPSPFPDPEAVWRIRGLVRQFKPDLVPAYGWLAHSAALALIGSGVPFVLWAHDYANVCAMRNLYRFRREICSGPAVGKCMACSVAGRGPVRGMLAATGVLGMRPILRRQTSALQSVSHYVSSALTRHLCTDGTASVVIPNFHEEDVTLPVDSSILKRLPQRPYILFVGSLSRVKGVQILLDAYRELVDPPPLVMAGVATPETPPIPSDVTVLHDVPHPTVMAMWDRALFGVFPSIWPEPLATVVHEAMSRGRPVIGTTPGGYEDMIDNGESGIIVPSGDPVALSQAMRKLVEDCQLREKMGIVAAERAGRFTREVVVPALEAFYYETAMLGQAKA
jgi:glycosyltransferase involved in cell wall biosynthesis